MKRILILLLLFLLFVPQPVSAHLSGQPPFFKMNGKLSGLYPVQTNSYFPEFTLPQDLAPETYLLDQPVTMEIDTKVLAQIIPQPIIDKTTFTWDFGDGSKGEGLTNTHRYKKMGSYVISINAEYTEDSSTKIPPQLIQSVMLHVLPDTKYQLPQAIIKVGGKEESKDSMNDVFEENLTEKIQLDGSLSKAPSSKIVSYFWDFDDGESSKDKVASHTYTAKRQYAGPSLRVKDANGFIADNFVGIRHNPKTHNTISSPQSSSKTYLIQWIILGLLGIGAVGVVGWMVTKTNKK